MLNLQDYDLRRYQKVAHLLNEKKGVLLDVGCGKGIFEYCNKSNGYDIYGFDNNKDNIITARRLFNKQRYKVSDANKKFPYEDKTFDIVVCIGLLEHIENPHNVLKECLRVLKPSGVGIINTPNAYHYDLAYCINKVPLPESVNFYFTPNVIKGVIERYGGHIKSVPFNLNFRRIYVKFSKVKK